MHAIANTAPAQSDQAAPSEDTAWAAVLGRDRGYDGSFFYAVRSTGIYCRPSCPARKPRRENVEFFRNPGEAEGEGYRACHRCRPRSASGTAAERGVQKAIEYLDAHLDEPITLEQLGAVVGMSPFHLQRTFKAQVGLSPRAYRNARRLERFKTPQTGRPGEPRHLRGRLRFQPECIRAGYGGPGHAAWSVPSRRPGSHDPLHYTPGAGRVGAGGCNRAWCLRCVPGRR